MKTITATNSEREICDASENVNELEHTINEDLVEQEAETVMAFACREKFDPQNVDVSATTVD